MMKVKFTGTDIKFFIVPILYYNYKIIKEINVMQNYKRALAIISMLAVLVLSMAIVSADDDAGDIIADDDSLDDVPYLEENNFSELQQAIDDADVSGTVYLNESYCPTQVEQNDYKVVNISKPVSIIGVENRTVIDAGSDVGVFEIVNANVLLKNIHFTNTEGCAVSILNSNVTFENCLFTYNYGDAGPAISIYNNESDITTTINQCNFNNNAADGEQISAGGAIFIASENYGAVTNIIKSAFINNSAANGGAIYIASDNAKASALNLFTCDFLYNELFEQEEYQFFGSDISFYNMADFNTINYELNANDTWFFHLPHSDVEPIVDSLLIPVKKAVFNNSLFLNAAIRIDNGLFGMHNCTFTSSGVSPNYFYLLYEEYNGNFPKGYVSNAQFDITDSNLTNGYFEFDGGNIINSTINCFSIVKNNKYKLNVLNSYIFNDTIFNLDNGNSFFTNCTFKDNPTAIDLNNGKITFTNSTFVNDGIYANYKNVNFINTTLTKVTYPIDVTVKSASSFYYNSGKYFSFKLTNANTGAVMKNFKFTVILYNSAYKKVKTYSLKTNAKGMAYLKGITALKPGYYYPMFKSTNYYLDEYELAFKISKAPTTVKAPKVTAKFKKSKYFKVTVKHKSTKKVVKSLKLKVKVYTGKKYKTYTIKTNSKGVAKLNTKKLKVGKHKVVISSGNVKYKVSAKSTIVIKR